MTHLATSLSLLSLVLGIFLTLSIWRRTVYQRASNKATMHRSISQTAIVRYFQVLSFGHLISLDTKLLTSGHSEVLEGHRLPRKLKLHIVWVCAGSNSYLKQIIEFGHKIIHGNIFITHFENHFLRLLLLNNRLGHHCRHPPVTRIAI